MRLLGNSYLSRFSKPLAAYNRLQTALMKRFVAKGGTPEIWIERMAPTFRERYGWLFGDAPRAAPVPVRRDRDPRSRRH
ncbi:MAG: hypothetical protein O7I93_02195 [Gemmatimonadetes bacterium]|nr:hypothetical protein [Gemmatimonadota bacterium]